MVATGLAAIGSPALAAVPVAHPEGEMVEVNGTRLWVETQGEGELLVLLPGGPAASHVVFHPHFDDLADQFKIVYYDYRGRGQSEKPSDPATITFENDVADLEALRVALGADKINIYGFSYGGLVAQAYALKFPHAVKRLVLANTLHSPEMWALNHQNINRELENQFPEIWEKIRALRDSGKLSSSPEMRELFAAHAAIIRWFNPDHAASLNTQVDKELYYRFVGEDIEFGNGGELLNLPDFRPRLRELSMPVMILAGRFDRALYPKLQWEFKKYCPQAKFVMLERSGSFGHAEETARVMELLREFLAS
jgi:proline iminopeptidase